MKGIFYDEDFLLWKLITQTRNAIVKARRRELAPYNFLTRQGTMLMIIKATGGMCTAYKIAQWSILEPHAISTLLQRTERDGLIRKIEKHDRKRSYRIELTEKGRKAYNVVIKLESHHKCMATLSKEERKQLKVILRKLRGEALKQIGITAKLPYPPF